MMENQPKIQDFGSQNTVIRRVKRVKLPSQTSTWFHCVSSVVFLWSQHEVSILQCPLQHCFLSCSSVGLRSDQRSMKCCNPQSIQAQFVFAAIHRCCLGSAVVRVSVFSCCLWCFPPFTYAFSLVIIIQQNCLC